MKTSITNYFNLKRNFYKEHPRVERRTWEEIDKFLNLHQIKFSGFDFPKPIFTLDEINFPVYIINEIRLQGIQRPSAIQSMTWPALYSGRDIMCIGLPTSSRVISYICPALVFIREQAPEIRRAGPLVLIVTQTKEVAKEILTHAQMFIHQSQCSYCCLFDDENINTQSVHLRGREIDIVIGNYHRLCELMDNDLVNLKNVSYLVLDDFYRNRSARLSDEIKRVVNETR
ncbi:atp-dependent rna helicase dbp2, partial [Brachionus plicatilis]